MATGSSSDDDDADNDVRPVERMEDIVSLVTNKQIDTKTCQPTIVKAADDDNECVKLSSDISDVDSTINKPSNGSQIAALEPMNLTPSIGINEESIVTTSSSVESSLVV